MSKDHHYKVSIKWTGNLGTGTSNYKGYSRNHLIQVEGKPPIESSSDSAFRGDPNRYNPEEMMVAALSSCHMLWYLHFCAEAGIIVTSYIDYAEGTMVEDQSGSGRFTEVILKPSISLANMQMMDQANALHAKANQFCFIANSCNFPVKHHAVYSIG
jgi:organic hydroperoxide reductase OsmC/OhrA